jgi:diguanylate cyclase (GGDEF)-like protein
MTRDAPCGSIDAMGRVTSRAAGGASVHRAPRAFALCAFALLAPLAAQAPAWAACVGEGPADLAELEATGFRNPPQAISLARQQLAAPATSAEPLRVAALHAIISEASRQTGQPGMALGAARQGLAALDGADATPLRVRLRIALALALQGTKQTDAGIVELDGALAMTEPRSKAAACVLKDRGWLHFDRSDIERALLDLTQAYELLRVHDDPPQRMITAGRLAAAYSTAREFDQAIRLLEETIAYFRATGALSRLPTAYDRLGRAWWQAGQLERAEEAFEQMRFRAVELEDSVAAAYADIRLCGVHLDAGIAEVAARHCGDAQRGLADRRDFDAEEGRLLNAYRGRLALLAGQPQDAVRLLDASLGGNPAELSRDLRAQFLRWRADAYGAIGRHEAATADLREYIDRARTLNANQTASQIALLRVRFATDREVEKVLQLARENSAQQAEAVRERQRLEREQQLRRLLTAITLIAVLLIAALGWLLRRNLSFRRQLQQLADRDDLTALPNRRRILEITARALRGAAASGQPLAIALLDLDHFKGINDRHGHATGDAVLRRFAAIASANLRRGDAIGRYGGEEFLIVLPATDIVAARAVIEGLRDSLRRLTSVDAPAGEAVAVTVTVSAGLAAARSQDGSAEDLIRRADLALYRAKETGRDRIEILPVPA